MVEVWANSPGVLLKMSTHVWRSGIKKATIWLELTLVMSVKCDKKGFSIYVASKKNKGVWTRC